MQYEVNPKNGDKLSRLGLGCMRFPTRAGGIDQDKASAIIREAVAMGVNYFDTAYIYPGSEVALGRALSEAGLRDRVFIATKLPLFLCKQPADFERLFNKQLERLRTNYVDYYFMHMLCDVESWERLRNLGILDWLAQKRAAGQIRNVGFSYHGGLREFPRLLDAHSWDFCMVQYNYLDEFKQAGRAGVEYAAGKGIPVFAMEPLRGGRLANGLPPKVTELFQKENKQRSAAEWGLRWIWNQKEVTLLLSGMSSLEQLRENAKLSDSAPPGHLSDKELAVYREARESFDKVIKVPCTGCGYCLPCPKGVDIPSCFNCYNASYSGGRMKSIQEYMQYTGGISVTQHQASQCVKCKKCESHCPQSIKISEEIPKAARRMEPFWYNPVLGLARKLLGVKRG